MYLWRRPTHAQAWYPLRLPWARLAEPLLKFLLPFAAVSTELFLDHLSEPHPYQRLYCPPGSAHAAHFAGDNINNWQHAASYPAFVLSGVIDLVSTQVPLPPGTNHGFLGLAFAVMAFLMGTHEKHEPLNKAVHWLLFVSMVLTLVCILLELHAPRHPLPAFAKAAAAILQGAWLVQIAEVEYDGKPQWDPTDGAGAMMAPVAFCMIGVLVVTCVAVLYLALAALWHFNLVPAALVPAAAAAAAGGGTSQQASRGGPRGPAAGALELPERKGLLFAEDTVADFDGDSANGGSCGGRSPRASRHVDLV